MHSSLSITAEKTGKILNNHDLIHFLKYFSKYLIKGFYNIAFSILIKKVAQKRALNLSYLVVFWRSFPYTSQIEWNKLLEIIFFCSDLEIWAFNSLKFELFLWKHNWNPSIYSYWFRKWNWFDFNRNKNTLINENVLLVK